MKTEHFMGAVLAAAARAKAAPNPRAFPLRFDPTLARLRALTWTWKDATVPVLPATVDVLGCRWGATAPWEGLDFTRAQVRERASIMVYAVGPDAPADHHLEVPWCHPDDQPHGWADGMLYRVRPLRPDWRFHRREDGVWVLRRAPA